MKEEEQEKDSSVVFERWKFRTCTNFWKGS